MIVVGPFQLNYSILFYSTLLYSTLLYSTLLYSTLSRQQGLGFTGMPNEPSMKRSAQAPCKALYQSLWAPVACLVREKNPGQIVKQRAVGNEPRGAGSGPRKQLKERRERPSNRWNAHRCHWQHLLMAQRLIRRGKLGRRLLHPPNATVGCERVHHLFSIELIMKSKLAIDHKFSI